MEIRYSAHGAYNHQYHIVWIPKYRKRVLKGEIKEYLKEGLKEIEKFLPEVEVKKFNIQEDHVHMVVVIPPKYSVSGVVGKMKANTSRGIRRRFDLKDVYWGNVFWSIGFFSSTVGIDEGVIKRYVEFQEKVDKDQLQLEFGFSVPRA